MTAVYDAEVILDRCGQQIDSSRGPQHRLRRPQPREPREPRLVTLAARAVVKQVRQLVRLEGGAR